jgi:hypothetical protein
MTGSLSISGATDQLELRTTGDYDLVKLFASNQGSRRWEMRFVDGETEGGSNNGSNFSLVAFDDDGVTLNSPIQIERSTGSVILSTDPSYTMGVATKQYVDNAVAAGGGGGGGGDASYPAIAGEWIFSSSYLMPPAVGEIRWSNHKDNPYFVYEIYLSNTTADGVYHGQLYWTQLITPNSKIYIVNKNDQSKWATFNITSFPEINNDYARFWVTSSYRSNNPLDYGDVIVTAQPPQININDIESNEPPPFRVTIQPTPPNVGNEFAGDLWYCNTAPGGLFIWYEGANGPQWVQTGSTLPASGGVEEAPEDGNQYARQDAEWVEIESGGGNTISGGSDGGNVWVSASFGNSGQGGSAYISSGGGVTNGGSVDIQGGQASNGEGGNIFQHAGDALVGQGGHVSIEAGNSYEGYGGDVNLKAGYGVDTGEGQGGGNVTVTAGTGNGNNSYGGNTTIRGGSCISASSYGGNVVIGGGDSEGSTESEAGHVNIRAGKNDGTVGLAGNVALYGGDQSSQGRGGNVEISPGTGPDGPGYVQIAFLPTSQPEQSNAVWLNGGALTIGDVVVSTEIAALTTALEKAMKRIEALEAKLV